MNSAMKTLGFLVLMMISAVVGFYGYQFQAQKTADDSSAQGIDAEAMIGQPRPAFQLNDLEGQLRDVGEWDGKVLVLNFWATWCPPCRDEIPEFMSLQEELSDQGVQFLGIALEKAEDVMPFYDELAVNYPSLVGQQAVIQVAKRYGNDIGALPYTVIIDKDGIIRSTKRGPLSLEEARQRILSLL